MPAEDKHFPEQLKNNILVALVVPIDLNNAYVKALVGQPEVTEDVTWALLERLGWSHYFKDGGTRDDSKGGPWKMFMPAFRTFLKTKDVAPYLSHPTRSPNSEAFYATLGAMERAQAGFQQGADMTTEALATNAENLEVHSQQQAQACTSFHENAFKLFETYIQTPRTGIPTTTQPSQPPIPGSNIGGSRFRDDNDNEEDDNASGKTFG